MKRKLSGTWNWSTAQPYWVWLPDETPKEPSVFRRLLRWLSPVWIEVEGT